MIFNTHGACAPFSGAVGGEAAPRPGRLANCFVCDSPLSALKRVAVRPGAVTHLFGCARALLSRRTAEGRADRTPRRAPHPFAPALCKTRLSPAGPTHQHRQEQAVAGSELIRGPRMLMNGETSFHVPNPNHQRA